jgi:pSer/pThr/pTyr-binding forkhead associated (FHA) protein
MAKLCLLNEDGDVADHWDLSGRPVAVGRGGSVDIRIDDDGLSRRHFMIFRDGEDFVIKDLSSRNGTWVVGARESTRTLRHNDFIRAGRSSFRFCEYGFPPRGMLKPGRGPHDTVVIAVGE